MKNRSHYYIYVLKLIEDRYYIGFTKNYKKRIKEHLKNKWDGSSYIKKYKIIAVVKIISINVDFWESQVYENVITIYFASIYGFKKVRGGNFTVGNDEQIEKQYLNTLQTRIITLNKIDQSINRIDIIREFNNATNLYNINIFNLGTEESEQQ